MSQMNIRRHTLGGLAVTAVAVVGALLMARTGFAADPPAFGPTVIGIASMDTIASGVREYKDLINTFENEKKSIDDANAAKQKDLKAIQDNMSILKSDSPDYAKKQDELLKASIGYDAWAKETQLDFDRNRKNKIRNLFNEISDAIAQVAVKDGLNLVITDQRPKIPDNLDGIDAQQLQQLIGARTVLYSDGGRDISQKVIDLMDKSYLNKTAPH